MRDVVRQLAALGALESEGTLDEQKLERFEQLLGEVSPPLTDEEARILVPLFGPDNAFGLGWTLLHLIETAPGWPLWDALGDPSNEWIRRLRKRLENAGIRPPE
ncbi:MAG: hypothetical protein IT379_39760 [Deltaproteobacteria bacterium]|nr:hypothetical protein [Deltaproteobacteria bacterium]